jgi:aspartate aminotransferase
MSPAISERGKAFPPSPIRKLVPYADRARAAGKRVLHLNIGQPDIPTPPAFFDAIRRYEETVLAYGPSTGMKEYVLAVQEYYRQWGLEFEPQEIIPTFGGSEAIIMAMLIVAETGDEIIVPEPFYTNYRCFALMAGVQLVPVPTEVSQCCRLPSYEELRKFVTPRTRAIMINTPNNPTGRVLELDELEAVRRLALEHDLFVLSDEVYREFVFDGKRHRSPADFADLRSRVIMLDSISKVFSSCGARVGCIASKNAEVMNSALRLAQGRLCAPTLEQIAAAAAYRARREYLPPVVEEYRRRRDEVFAGLAEMREVTCPMPSGAFYAMLDLPVDDAEKFIVWMLTSFDVNGETVMLAPGDGFYATPGKGVHEARIAYVLEPPKLRRAMSILRQGLAAYPG